MAELPRTPQREAARSFSQPSEAHGVSLVAIEDGLGKLAAENKASKSDHQLNAWDWTTVKLMLVCRLGLREAALVKVRADHSTTFGNLAFALPDAWASAFAVSRRGFAEMDEVFDPAVGLVASISSTASAKSTTSSIGVPR